jgi:hypothetical protein
MNGELVIMRKEAIVAYFKVLFRHFPEETEKNMKHLGPNSRFPGRDSNPKTSEHKDKRLTTGRQVT